MMRLGRRHLLVVLLGALVGLGVLLAPRGVKREPRLPEPSYLSPGVRTLLQDRMARHGRLMMDLTRSVIVLDYPGAQQIADEVVAEPRLSRPPTKDATLLNSELPEAFFVLQDGLRDQALALSRAAQSRDPERLGEAWSALSKACVSCHKVYLGETAR